MRNPEAMRVKAAKTEEQTDTLEPLAALMMERFGVAPGIPPRDVVRVILAFSGVSRASVASSPQLSPTSCLPRPSAGSSPACAQPPLGTRPT